MTAEPTPPRSSLLIDSTLFQPPAYHLDEVAAGPEGTRHDHVVRARALGQLDRATLPMVTEELVAVARRGFAASPWSAAPAIDLELSGLTFLCTCALAALNEAWQQIGELGGRLCLTCPRPQVLYVLDLAMFSGSLPNDLECDQDHPWAAPTTPIGGAGTPRHRVNLSPARPRTADGQVPLSVLPRVSVARVIPPRHPGAAA